ncbi:MAG: DUF1499 domain-containing protein [Desulfobacterales bacterium]|nr:DUF1499 domain-containing protein [Desulfobacterales bacterium]
MSLKQISILFCISLGATPISAGMTTHREMFSPCPASPNCVSSLSEDQKHFVEPIAYNGSIAQARQRLINILQNTRGARLVIMEKDFLHAEYRSFVFGFVDDVVFYLPADKPVIHIKSASRSGHYDFGVNRRRVERLRAAFKTPLQDASTEKPDDE